MAGGLVMLSALGFRSGLDFVVVVVGGDGCCWCSSNMSDPLES